MIIIIIVIIIIIIIITVYISLLRYGFQIFTATTTNMGYNISSCSNKLKAGNADQRGSRIITRQTCNYSIQPHMTLNDAASQAQITEQ